MDVTITIPNAKLNEFKTGFLKENPVPIDEETGLPAMTEIQWLKAWIIGELKREYASGKRRIAIESSVVVIEDNGIT
jgi:hypothetical protein